MIQLKNSALKNIRVLVLDDDEQKIGALEVQAESDPELQRLEVLTSSSLHEARDLVRRKDIAVCFYSEAVGTSDVLEIQTELRHASNNLALIPLIAQMDLATLREMNRIGGVIDYQPPTVLDSYPQFKNMVLNFARSQYSFNLNLEVQNAYSGLISRSLTCARPDSTDVKENSRVILQALLPHYDLGQKEISQLFSAESIYRPWLSDTSYQDLLGEDPHGLLPLLLTSSSWQKDRQATVHDLRVSDYRVELRCVFNSRRF